MIQKEIESSIVREGPVLREKLLHADPLLRPDTLAELIPSYALWHPMRTGYRLWSSHEKFPHVLTNYLQHDKVILGLSGVSVGGKDALREEMIRLAPGFLWKIVTATSRLPKPGEQDRTDYYFYPDAEALLVEVAKGGFIEATPQGNRWYGLPKRSLNDALARPEPITVTHVEMGAWPEIETYIGQEYQGVSPYFLRVFTMPEMSAREYFQDWLPSHRPADQVESRANRAAWEIYEAPHRTDFLVTNVMSDTRPTLQWEATALLGVMNNLLRLDVPKPILERFPDLGVGYLNVPSAQDAVLPH